MDEQEKYAFLADEAPDDEVAEAPVTETPDPDAATVVTAETPPPEVTTTPEPQEERVPVAAVIAERRKRQDAETRLRQYEQQAQQQPIPKFNEAPEQHVQAILARERQNMTQFMYSAMEEMAKATYPDYDEAFAEVEQYVAENPAALHQLQNAANPAVAAYKLGKQVRELREMKDPDAYRQKIEAEVRAKVEVEHKAKEEARLKAANAIPPDLTAARASRTDEVLPDDSLDSILKSKR